jgi:hypothetical protein
MLKCCIITLMCISSAPFVHADTALVPFSYSEDFESGELNAWASYPLWQDTAFDPWLKIDTIVPGDPNKSLEQTINAFWNEDSCGGVQKLLDLYLVKGSHIGFRYYFKSHKTPEALTIRFAAGPYGKLDVSIKNPSPNRWNEVNLPFDDIVLANPPVRGLDRLHIHDMAIFVKLLSADPSMNFFLGLDDVRIEGMQMAPFQFEEPRVHRLTEFREVIPDRHFSPGETIAVKGAWKLDADRVIYTVVPFTDRTRNIKTGLLVKSGEVWRLDRLTLSFPAGLYLLTLQAHKGDDVIAETVMTLCLLPDNPGGRHPRLWFDKAKMDDIKLQLADIKHRNLSDSIAIAAGRAREKLPLEKVVYDIDQFPAKYYFEFYRNWFNRLYDWRSSVYNNALAYAFLGDEKAGRYAKDVLVQICGFPTWLHPWIRQQGWSSYYILGETGMQHAMAFDLLQPLMTEKEKASVRKGLMNNIVLPTHRGFVEDNFVTNDTSNWIAMATGGSLVCQAVMYGDGPDVSTVEPYFTGALLKLSLLIDRSVDPDGAYGEGSYLATTMLQWNHVLPVLERNFAIDLSKPIRRVYEEAIWGGIVKSKRIFQFGDGNTTSGIPNSWWLLSKYHDPLLGWAYNHFKGSETIEDLIFDTASAPRQAPYKENPVRVFRNVGITVFKSGWENDDFVFVMKTGAFYNHQHMDQGSFYLSDRGSDFVIDKHPGTGYWYSSRDPQYLTHQIQPVGHSTILIDHVKQSQRTGDPLGFAEGFDDRAFMYQFLDGSNAAFSSGDIGRIYWGRVKELRRNVLYLKPRALLMLDTVTPLEDDVDITLLYQTSYLRDITTGSRVSTIAKGDKTLHIAHLNPENIVAKAEEAPHFVRVLSEPPPLIREGMLTVTARTSKTPLVVANLLTTTAGSAKPPLTSELRRGYGIGAVDGTPFAYSTSPGHTYDTGEFSTDALALTWKDRSIFAALCTTLSRNGKILVKSQEPITCELSPDSIKYYSPKEGRMTLSVSEKTSRVSINGKTATFTQDNTAGTVTLIAPAGEGLIVIK